MIECKNLSVGYKGMALKDNINFKLEPADYLCILGENGAGKSTLMKTILELIPPVSGEINIENRKELGYLPQQIARQKDFPATVEEIVQSGCLSKCGLRPFYNKAEKQKAIESMERLGLTNLRKRCYRELSGGQQERVLLARALCTSGKMLLLDEPTSGLDPQITQDLYALLGDLNKNEKVTLIVISHDLSASLKFATKILYLGKDNFFGTKDDFIEWKENKNEQEKDELCDQCDFCNSSVEEV